jgi:hypothetical protein
MTLLQTYTTSTIRLYADDALLHSRLTNATSITDFQNNPLKLDEWAVY